MKNNKMRTIMLIIAALMILVSGFPSMNKNNQSVSANSSLDPASKLLCKFEDGQTLVKFNSTDYFYYLIRSKSAVTSIQDVDRSWLNKLLEITGHDFDKANEAVLGRPIRSFDESPDKTPKEANEESSKVSAFDRFGVAGLKWSSYQGEWKYYDVNPCASQDSVSPTTFGEFYTERLEPQSTHNEVPTSVDPRSVQFNKTVWNSLLTAFTDILSNMMFSLTKGIVTLTIIFVGLSFTDITTMLGMLKADGTAGGSAEGVFTGLFDGVFTSFVVLGVIFSALHILYKGLIKRELRFALNSLIKTIAIFIIAVTMAYNPSYWVGLPNKAATYGQALILSSMSTIYEDEDGKASLCTTEIASIDEGVDLDMSNPDSFKTQFEQTNENMRSMIACNMWQVLLLEPWAKGQFGADYKDMADSEVKNDNEDWVGTASVPVGDGKTIDNWALFHLSTQTNAHVPSDGDSYSVIVNGVNADWWRIVDALSDYEEEEELVADPDGAEQTFYVPVDKKTTSQWQSWIGNNRTERMGIALISIVFGIVGSLAPLVFGIASAVYGLGITLFMMASPVFFLFGVIGTSRGDGIFFGWLSALANTIIKKIVAGLLLILSLSFSMAIMGLISDVGFITSFILMVITTSLLIKNRNKIFDMLASVDFGGAFDPRQKANQFMNVQKKTAQEVTKMTAAAVGGSVAAHKSGQSIVEGAGAGMQRQLSNRMHTTQLGMNFMRQKESVEGRSKSSNHTCVQCHKPVGSSGEVETAYRDDYGNYYCVTCADEMGLENLHEVVTGKNSGGNTNQFDDRHGVIAVKDERSINASLGLSELPYSVMQNASQQVKIDDQNVWQEDEVQDIILQNIGDVQRDFIVFKNIQAIYKRRVNIPSMPQPIEEYIDLPLINKAWEQERIDVIEQTYKEAWKMWYEDNAKLIAETSEEDIEEFTKQIDDLKIDIDEEEVEKLMEAYFSESAEFSNVVNEAPSYVVRNGVVRLQSTDIEETDDRLS